MASGCRNCGHESHCGVPLVKDVAGYAEEERIVVCRKCRCGVCSN
jgi:hypothetical protein